MAPNTGYCFTPNPIETERQLFNGWFNWGWCWRTWEEAKDHRKVLLFLAAILFVLRGERETVDENSAEKTWWRIWRDSQSVCVCVFGLFLLNQTSPGHDLIKTQSFSLWISETDLRILKLSSTPKISGSFFGSHLPPGCSWKPLKKPSPKWDCPMRGAETNRAISTLKGRWILWDFGTHMLAASEVCLKLFWW